MQLISEISKDLGGLAPGDRFWFWLCPALPADESPMRVTRLADDPAREQLESLASGADIGLADVVYRGLGSVLEDGRMSFGAPGLTREVLEAVAAWVHTNVLDEPGLAVLTDAVFLDIGPDGTVRAQSDDPELWGLAARVQAAGTG